MNPRLLVQALFLLAVWVPVLEFLELEWRFNEQYHFGYFVPLFTLYLFYLRWDDRPSPDPKHTKQNFMWALLPLIGLGLLQVVQTANPDWRLIYWLGTMLALTVTFFWLSAIGGRRWLQHFAPALVMILFAVPWFTFIENRITSSLMQVVSVFTVEVLNLAGIYAVQMGNVIHLQDTVVGVEEACSGVRSLQSSLMAGYLFGEIIRFRIGYRTLLIASGVVVTFILNLGRTLTLTFITIHQGAEAFDKWHDTVGNVVAIGGFLAIALLAWLLSKINRSKSEIASASMQEASPSPLVGSIPFILLILFSAIPLGAIGLDHWWYQDSSEEKTSQFAYGEIQWDRLSDHVTELEMDPIAVAQLKFSEGNHYSWDSSKGSRWNAFYFHWKEGSISSHAGVHRPENCLPSAGMKQLSTNETLIWKTPEGYDIPFRTLTFEGFGEITYVFFAVWDENGSQPWLSTTWKDRMMDVVHKRVVKGRHSLQFLVANVSSFERAKTEWAEMLKLMYPTDN